MKNLTPIVGAVGTAGTFSLAHANEVLGFICGVLTAAYMGVKLYGKIQKLSRKKNPQQELDLDTDL